MVGKDPHPPGSGAVSSRLTAPACSCSSGACGVDGADSRTSRSPRCGLPPNRSASGTLIATGSASRPDQPVLVDVAPVVQPAQLLEAVVVRPAGAMAECVAQEMHVAALPRGLLEYIPDDLPQPVVIVADHELHPMQAPIPQPGEKVLPGAAGLPVGHLHPQDLAPAVPVDADGDQHRLGTDHAFFSDLLGALVALEQLSGEPAFPVPGHPQFQFADAGDEAARVVAGAVAGLIRVRPPGSSVRAQVISYSRSSCKNPSNSVRRQSSSSSRRAFNFTMADFLLELVVMGRVPLMAS